MTVAQTGRPLTSVRRIRIRLLLLEGQWGGPAGGGEEMGMKYDTNSDTADKNSSNANSNNGKKSEDAGKEGGGNMGDSELDVERLLWTSAYGAMFNGTVGHAWYSGLDAVVKKVWTPGSVKFVASKVAADSFLLALSMLLHFLGL